MAETVEISWDDAMPEERDRWVSINVFGFTDFIPDHYTTDPKYDTDVLRRVRREWNYEDFAKFLIALKQIQSARTDEFMKSRKWYAYPDGNAYGAMYMTGDYSHAAYLAKGGR